MIDKKIISNTDETSGNLKGTRILIAEDNEINIFIIKKYFKDWEVDFDIASNGEKAIELAEANTYNLILMDLNMPILNGYEATRAIRKNTSSSNHNIPIYALSASIGISVDDELNESGMNGLLYKPFVPLELYTTLSKIIKDSKTK
ncbi:response regulator [Cellulophaga sp. HaHaR_3_176]|uniref:response regulator n=1 Tax=Cellulophaga sp. HaHaR_3_176 TaxID=1942464 RepID=UPI001C1F63A3|nr:response regulator [Cellulophaga sp. HaHaR_3_176]QWX82657.1 response regulator [Cellulophaga sp. HaHaR_3_176]